MIPKRPYGKDSPESFISGALKGGSGPSNGIDHVSVDRPQQAIHVSTPMDNVKLACPMESSIRDLTWKGSTDNIKHSLTGASAVNEEVGAAGPLRHVIIPNH